MTDQEGLEALEGRLRAVFAEVAPPPLETPARTATRPGTARRLPGRPLLAPLAAAAIVLLAAGLLAWRVGYLGAGGRGAGTAMTWRGDHLVITGRPAAAVLGCRLPVSVLATNTTGFVDLGSGSPSFTAVSGSGTYVPKMNRWVDVLPQMVAPSGDAYVDQSPGGPARIVSASGTTSSYPVPAGAEVTAWTGEGILLTWPDPTLQTELLDPSNGSIRDFALAPQMRISGSGSMGYLRGDDSLWTESDTPSGTVITSQSVATGTVEQWLKTSQHAHVVGTTAGGDPIIQVGSRDLTHLQPNQQNGVTEETLLLTAPGQETVLNRGRVGGTGVAADLSPLSVTSGGTVWMADEQGGIWTYTEQGGMQLAAQIRTSDDGPPGVSISGPCQ